MEKSKKEFEKDQQDSQTVELKVYNADELCRSPDAMIQTEQLNLMLLILQKIEAIENKLEKPGKED